MVKNDYGENRTIDGNKLPPHGLLQLFLRKSQLLPRMDDKLIVFIPPPQYKKQPVTRKVGQVQRKKLPLTRAQCSHHGKVDKVLRSTRKLHGDKLSLLGVYERP